MSPDRWRSIRGSRARYSGGGFTLGAGYAKHVSSYNTVDFRGSYTLKNYKRIEAEFLAPRLFDRHAWLSVIGGWREATQVALLRLRHRQHVEGRPRQLQFPAACTCRRSSSTGRRAGTSCSAPVLEFAKWDTGPGSGTVPSVEEVYTPSTLPGLNASPTYVHPQGTIAFDWRPAKGYARTGGLLRRHPPQLHGW